LERLKRAVIISLFFLNGAAYASNDLLISAESVEYDKEGRSVEATGNVILTYKDIDLKSYHIIFENEERVVYADKGFVLRTEDQLIKGTKLSYGIDSRRGEAENVKVELKGLYMKGGSINIDPERIILEDSSFTTCDQSPPHYKMSASNMTFYPKTKLLYAYWGWFHAEDVPLIPVPTYVYDLNPQDRDRNAAPLPEIGSNDIDGWYAIERLSWHANSRTYGTVSLTYAEKKGPGGGVEANYIADDDVTYNARINTSEKDGWWGGTTYYRYFNTKRNAASSGESTGLYDLLFKRKALLGVNLSSRERINYQRVSLLPEVSLKYSKDYLIDNIKYDWELRSGRIYEEGSALDISRTALNGEITYDFPEIALGVFGLGTDGAAKFYSQGSKWGQVFGTASLNKKFNDTVSGGIGYKHVIANRGSSPFIYENYRFEPEDYVFGDVYFDLYSFRLGVNASYYVPDWDPRDIDYMVMWHLGCMDISATYRALRNEVTFGFLLVSN
jgi:hypothetical protein